MADNTCQSEYCNAGWGEVLTHMSPYGYANFGIAFGLGLSVVGAAWGIWLTGSSLVGAAVKAPRIRSKNLIRCVRVGGGKQRGGMRVAFLWQGERKREGKIRRTSRERAAASAAEQEGAPWFTVGR